jgi:glycerate kinase
MRLVAAPNPFKGSLGAPQAASAIARGVAQVFPQAEVLLVPVADGGEGTVEALVAAAGGELRGFEVQGPLSGRVEAALGLIEGGRTAVVELASASGLGLVPADLRDPRLASTHGFGELLAAARDLGVGRIIAGIGGSATNDAGAGMAQALGFRLLDDRGQELGPGGAELARLDRIERSARPWTGIQIEVACDVSNPLLGPDGASAVYGPQKGANPDVVQELDAALANFARVVERDLGVAVAGMPGAGAAGGAGAGLVAFLGAELTPGAALVVTAAGLDRALEGASAVFTGEGRLDRQTGFGKGPAEVSRRAHQAGVPVVVLAGGLGPGWQSIFEAGASAVVPLAEGPSVAAELEADAAGLLERAAARACRLIAVGLELAGKSPA